MTQILFMKYWQLGMYLYLYIIHINFHLRRIYTLLQIKSFLISQ